MCLEVKSKHKPYNATKRKYVYKVAFQTQNDGYVNLFLSATMCQYVIGEKCFSNRYSFVDGKARTHALTEKEITFGINEGIHVFTNLKEAKRFVKVVNDKNFSLRLKSWSNHCRLTNYDNVVVLKCEVSYEDHVADGRFLAKSNKSSIEKDFNPWECFSSAVYHSIIPIKQVYSERFTRFEKQNDCRYSETEKIAIVAHCKNGVATMNKN